MTLVLALDVDDSRSNWQFSFLSARFYAKCFARIILFTSYSYPVSKDRFTDESVQACWASQLAPDHTASETRFSDFEPME